MKEIYIVIGMLGALQCIYTGVKKRKDKNFYLEPKLISFLSAGAGIIPLLYGLMGLRKMSINSDENVAIILLGVMVLLAVYVTFRSFFGTKKYTVYNIAKTDLEAVLLQTLKKYELECRKEVKHPHSMVTKILLEQYDAFIEVTQRGGNGTTFDLVFEKFDKIYNFEDIVMDMKEGINASTKAGRFRGVLDFAAAIVFVLIAAWMSNLGANF